MRISFGFEIRGNANEVERYRKSLLAGKIIEAKIRFLPLGQEPRVFIKAVIYGFS